VEIKQHTSTANEMKKIAREIRHYLEYQNLRGKTLRGILKNSIGDTFFTVNVYIKKARPGALSTQCKALSQSPVPQEEE
jgi:hypothetical protein